MASLYLLVPLGVLTVFAAIAVFIWAAGSGQFEQLDDWSTRMPDDED